MNPDLYSFRCLTDWVESFEQQLFDGKVLNIGDHFPPREHPEFQGITAEILRVALEYFWDRGEQNYFSELKNSFPWLARNPEIIGPVAFEDYRLRLSCGLPASVDVYQSLGINTCDWNSLLNDAELLSQTAVTRGGSSTHLSSVGSRSADRQQASNLDVNELLADRSRPTTSDDCRNLHTSSARLPAAGDRLGDFLLIEQLGAGAFSRVFIARQLSLAARPIVLKVAYMPLGESERLARLQHANIVPLYFAESVHGFYLLGMPLLGVLTLKDVIEECHDLPNRSGDAIAKFIRSRFEKVQLLIPELADQFSNQTDMPQVPMLPIDEVSGKSWEEAILNIVARLADGLDYAHRRGLQHRDIKPANILIGFDGQPMLLDFNLSRDRFANSRDWSIVGTLPYMSPEQIDRPAPDHEPAHDAGIPGDIYSLGVVLYEALTGCRPHDFSDCNSGDFKRASELKRGEVKRPRKLCVTTLAPASEAIVLKCLQYSPTNRYKLASQLCEDIRRHLSSLPLRHCPNPSTQERAAKWLRRNSSLFSAGSLIAVAMVSLLTAGFMFLILDRSERKSESQQLFSRFRATAIQAEAALFFADGGAREPGRMKAIEALRLVDTLGDRSSRSPLLLFLNDAQRSEIESKADYLATLLDAESAVDSATFAASGSQDRIVLATQAYFAGRFSDAITLLEAEAAEPPQRFVVWFLKGRSHFVTNDYQQAKQCFMMASALEPTSATCWVAKGTCDHQLGRYTDAIEDYNQAIDLEPENFAAFYNRALAYEKLHAYDQSLASLAVAERLAPSSTRVHMARRRTALAAGDLKLADAELKRLIELEPTVPEDWILRGLAKLPQDAQGALHDFSKAKNWQTTRTIAFQNSAHVLSEILQRTDEAIDQLSMLLSERPDFLPALGGRAVLSARIGRLDAALADISLCEQQTLTPQMHYQLACAYALLADQQQSLGKKALQHLAIAASPAYGAQQIASDSDLDNLRQNSDFRAILNGIDATKRVQILP